MKKLVFAENKKWLWFGLIFLYLLFLIIDPTAVPNLVRSFQSPDVKGVTLAGFKPHVWLTLIMTMCLVALASFRLTKVFWQNVPGLTLGKIIACLPLGYIIIQPVLRITTWFVPPGATFYFVVSLIFCYLVYDYSRTRTAVMTPKELKPSLQCFGLCALLMVFILTVQVYYNHFAWVGHGPVQYSFLLEQFRKAGRTFPLFNQHYEELQFSYFLTDPFELKFNPILAMWLTLAAIKTSSLYLIYYLCRSLKLERLEALTITAFLGFASFSLHPAKYFFLFDSSNPILITVHSGRVIGIPMMLFALAWWKRHIEEPNPGVLLPWIFWILLGAGLTASPISNYIDFMLILSMLWIFSHTSNRRPLPFGFLASLYALSFGALLMTYGSLDPNVPMQGHPGWPMSFTVLAMLILAGYGFWQFGRRPLWSRGGSLELGLLFISGLIFIFIGGNVFADNSVSRSLIDLRNQLFGGSPLVVQPSTYDISEKFIPQIFHDFRELAEHNGYNRGFFGFLSYYGLTYVLAGAALLSTWRKIKEPDALMLQMVLLFSTLLTSCFFLCIDFYDGFRPWVKTRFLEVPVYVMLFCSMFLLMRVHRKPWLTWGLTALTAVNILLPDILWNRFAQWHLNFLWILQEILGGKYLI